MEGYIYPGYFSLTGLERATPLTLKRQAKMIHSSPGYLNAFILFVGPVLLVVVVTSTNQSIRAQLLTLTIAGPLYISPIEFSCPIRVLLSRMTTGYSKIQKALESHVMRAISAAETFKGPASGWPKRQV